MVVDPTSLACGDVDLHAEARLIWRRADVCDVLQSDHPGRVRRDDIRRVRGAAYAYVLEGAGILGGARVDFEEAYGRAGKEKAFKASHRGWL